MLPPSSWLFSYNVTSQSTLLLLYHSNVLTIRLAHVLKDDMSYFYPIMATFKVMGRPRDKLVPLLGYVIAVINSSSLTSLNKLIRFFLFKKKHTIVMLLRNPEK